MRWLTFTLMRFGLHPAIAGIASYTLIVIGCIVVASVIYGLLR